MALNGTEKILFLGYYPDPKKPGYFLLPSRDFYVSDLDRNKEKNLKWLELALAKIEKAAEAAPKVKAFMEFTKSIPPRRYRHRPKISRQRLR